MQVYNHVPGRADVPGSRDRALLTSVSDLTRDQQTVGLHGTDPNKYTFVQPTYDPMARW